MELGTPRTTRPARARCRASRFVLLVLISHVLVSLVRTQQVAPRVKQERCPVRAERRVVVPGRALVRRIESVITQRRLEIGEKDVRATVRRLVPLRLNRIAEPQ